MPACLGSGPPACGQEGLRSAEPADAKSLCGAHCQSIGLLAISASTASSSSSS